MQPGGCRPDGACRGPHPFMGANFRYLSASPADRSTGETLSPAYLVKEFDGVPVAFIGITLKATPKMVTPPDVITRPPLSAAQTGGNTPPTCPKSLCDHLKILKKKQFSKIRAPRAAAVEGMTFLDRPPP
jgi:hypothetical protein